MLLGALCAFLFPMVALSAAGASPALSARAALALIEEQTSKKACTSATGPCTFECEIGDTLYVAASGGLFLSASALCGGRGTHCTSTLGGFCEGESDGTVPAADPHGSCEASQFIGGYPGVTCGAGPKQA